MTDSKPEEISQLLDELLAYAEAYSSYIAEKWQLREQVEAAKLWLLTLDST